MDSGARWIYGLLLSVLLLVLATAGGIVTIGPLGEEPAEAAGNTLIVGGGGYGSINAALSAAGAGDTIRVHAGNYGELVEVNKSVTIKGVGDGAVKSGVYSRTLCPPSPNTYTWRSETLIITECRAESSWSPGAERSRTAMTPLR